MSFTKPKTDMTVLINKRIGKYHFMVTKEVVIPRKIRKDKGTHKYPNKGQTGKLVSWEGQPGPLKSNPTFTGTVTDPRD